MNVENIVEVLGQHGLIRPHKITGSYYQIYCPIHNDGNERHPSFGVLLREEVRNGQRYPEGFCHCFTCGFAKGIPDLITELLKRKSINKSGLDWLVENIPGFEPDIDYELLIPKDVSDKILSNFKPQSVDEIKDLIASLKGKNNYITEEELAKYRFTVPYMYERKLTDEAIEHFDIGFDAEFVAPGRTKVTPSLTFPVRDYKGRTLFIYRRAIESKFFSMPSQTNKPLYGVYELNPNTECVIICESILNAVTAWTYGYQAIALMGTGTKNQVQLIKQLGMNKITLCLDGDEAGYKATARLRKSLSSSAFIDVIEMPEGKDVNDCTKEEFNELYERSKDWRR